MFQDDVPASSRAPDQVWFSMIMVNDPNAALFGTLRPPRPHPLLAAMRRPFERDTLAASRPVSKPIEREPASSPRISRWLAVGLVLLGFGGAEAALEAFASNASPEPAAVASTRVGATTLETPPAPASRAEPAARAAGAALAGSAPAGLLGRAPATPPPIAVSAVQRSSEPVASARAAGARAPSASVKATSSSKKKAAARQRRRAFGRALAARTKSGT